MLNITKATYNKPVANIILKSEIISFEVWKETRVSPFLFNIMLEILVRAKGQEREMEEVKLCVFADDMILYLKDPRFHQKFFRYDKFS
jgi:hypothetical protein